MYHDYSCIIHVIEMYCALFVSEEFPILKMWAYASKAREVQPITLAQFGYNSASARHTETARASSREDLFGMALSNFA